jgi:hypothetical protein
VAARVELDGAIRCPAVLVQPDFEVSHQGWLGMLQCRGRLANADCDKVFAKEPAPKMVW